MLSLLPFGIIVAAVAAIAVVTVVAVVLVAPATAALAAFVVALTVVPTMFLAVDVGLMFDCCVPLLPEEDNHLPPPSGKVLSWPLSPFFVDCRRRRRMTSPLPHHSFTSAASWLIVVYPCHQRRTIISLLPWGRFRHGPCHPPLSNVATGRTTSPLPCHSFASAASWSHSLFACFLPPPHI